MNQDDDISSHADPTLLDREEAEREQLRAYADCIAKVLDSSILIPGTSLRIGLDPLLGLIPGIGDIIANAIGSIILFLAARLQIPKIVIARMSLNLLLNTLVGAIPGIGDLFSVWFKSNVKNACLLRKYSRRVSSRSTGPDWIFVIGLLIGIVSLVLGTAFIIIWTLKKLWQMT